MVEPTFVDLTKSFFECNNFKIIKSFVYTLKNIQLIKPKFS